jgi:hypothetical protein
MDAISIPTPDIIRERITACEDELRTLRRLLRLSQTAQDAEDARKRRIQATPPEEVRRAD